VRETELRERDLREKPSLGQHACEQTLSEEKLETAGTSCETGHSENRDTAETKRNTDDAAGSRRGVARRGCGKRRKPLCFNGNRGAMGRRLVACCARHRGTRRCGKRSKAALLTAVPWCDSKKPRTGVGREKPIENRRRLCEAETRSVAASCPVGRTRPLTDTHSLRRRRSTGLRDNALREDKKLINDGVSARETES
jgi:hypothetical protein